MVNDEVVGTGAGRLEVRHVYYIINLHVYIKSIYYSSYSVYS